MYGRLAKPFGVFDQLRTFYARKVAGTEAACALAQAAFDSTVAMRLPPANLIDLGILVAVQSMTLVSLGEITSVPAEPQFALADYPPGAVLTLPGHIC
jgi:hypothetical protein